MQKVIIFIAFALVTGVFFSCKKNESHLNTNLNDTVKTTSPYPITSGDLAGWKQVLAEDFLFSSTSDQFSDLYGKSWSPYDNGGKYYQSAISASNGMMKIALNGTTGAAGVFGPTATRWGHLYGRYSICFKAVAADGNGTAILIWPSSDIWGDGEIDYPEGNFESTLQVFHHGVGCMECAAADGFNTGVSWREWHIATTEWTPSTVKYYLDKQLIKTVTHDIPKNNHRFTIQMAPNTNNSLPGYFYIDWVTIYYPVP